jgi:hypothetical protein
MLSMARLNIIGVIKVYYRDVYDIMRYETLMVDFSQVDMGKHMPQCQLLAKTRSNPTFPD